MYKQSQIANHFVFVVVAVSVLCFGKYNKRKFKKKTRIDFENKIHIYHIGHKLALSEIASLWY